MKLLKLEQRQELSEAEANAEDYKNRGFIGAMGAVAADNLLENAGVHMPYSALLAGVAGTALYFGVSVVRAQLENHEEQ